MVTRGFTQRITRDSLPYRLYAATTDIALPPAVQRQILIRGRRIFRSRAVFLACFMKSGSTLLSEAFDALPRWRQLASVNLDARTAQVPGRDLIARDWASARSHALYKNHVPHSPAVHEIIQSFQMTPVLLVRDLSDVCRSLSDHFDRESTDVPFLALEPDQLAHLDRQNQRADFIADLALPWFVHVYASWIRFQNAGHPLLVLDYTDLANDLKGSMESILDLIGLHTPASAIENAIASITLDPSRTRLNIGTAGRGTAYLEQNPAVASTIRRLIGYYPDVDFGPITRTL